MNMIMSERFNVARRHAGQAVRPPRDEARVVRGQGGPGPRHRRHPGHVRPRVFFVALTLTAALATALVYGFGGVAVVDGDAVSWARWWRWPPT